MIGREFGTGVGTGCRHLVAHPFVMLGLGQLFVGQALQQSDPLRCGCRPNARKTLGQLSQKVGPAAVNVVVA